MVLEITEDRTDYHHREMCPDCETGANKIWISHYGKWIPIGILCKKCGFLMIWGVEASDESLHKESNIK